MSNIRGLSDFTNSNKGKGNDSDSDDDDKPQQFFAGGEKSGVAIQGPPKGKNLVKDIMGKAANADSQETQQTPSHFSGSGHRLGTENDEPSSSSSSAAAQQPQQQTQRQELHEPVERRLTFWQDGFTVEFGALMRYDDPANEALLQAINNGTAPLSLLNVLPGQQVTVNIEEHLSEPWTKEAADKYAKNSKPAGSKEAKMKAFSGAGHRLGSEVPAESSSALPGGFPSSSSSSSSAAPPPAVSAAISVDPNAPTTSIQIRLADGTRLVARMNHTHTVGDLRSFVQASRPGQGAFAIMTTFPNRDLTEDGVSLKEAGLLNAVVVQRML